MTLLEFTFQGFWTFLGMTVLLAMILGTAEAVVFAVVHLIWSLAKLVAGRA